MKPVGTQTLWNLPSGTAALTVPLRARKGASLSFLWSLPHTNERFLSFFRTHNERIDSGTRSTTEDVDEAVLVRLRDGKQLSFRLVEDTKGNVYTIAHDEVGRFQAEDAALPHLYFREEGKQAPLPASELTELRSPDLVKAFFSP